MTTISLAAVALLWLILLLHSGLYDNRFACVEEQHMSVFWWVTTAKEIGFSIFPKIHTAVRTLYSVNLHEREPNHYKSLYVLLSTREH